MGGKLSKEGFTKNYKLQETLGTGSFATVRKGIRSSDKSEFAIKIIKKNKLNQDELAVVHDEVTIMHKINHANCVHLYEMYESKTKVFMVLELLTGGELFDRIVTKGSYSEKDAADLIKSITGAIKYLHSVGVVHRDLKPENLIYQSNNSDVIKITDFGLAKFQNAKTGTESEMNTACGTPGYVAPEVLKNQAYGAAVDLWSMGVILYILLCGFPPFYHDSTSQLYKQIKKGAYDFPDPYWTDISEDAKSVVQGLLTVDPAQRMTPDQVLSHTWLGGSASNKALGNNQAQGLKLMLLKRKLRAGVQTIIAMNKFKVALEAMI